MGSVRSWILSRTRATCELDCQALSVQCRPICSVSDISLAWGLFSPDVRRLHTVSYGTKLVEDLEGIKREGDLTRDHISRVNRLIVLDEAEAIHDFDLADGTRSILEVIRDILLGD